MGRVARPRVAAASCSTASAPTRAGASAATAPRCGSSMRITPGHASTWSSTSPSSPRRRRRERSSGAWRGPRRWAAVRRSSIAQARSRPVTESPSARRSATACSRRSAVCSWRWQQRGARTPDAFEQSLTVLYRVLFLLFAEARGLVPVWHPVYRDRYSIDRSSRTLLAGRRYRGIWRAMHGDLAARPRRLFGRRAEGDGVQRPPLRARPVGGVRSNAHR